VTLTTLALRSAVYHWRTNVAVILGVAAAVSVLAGALVVGDSVRGSLREIALGRLGNTDTVLASAGFLQEAAADQVRQALGASAVAPLIVADAFVTLESSGRRAANVIVYGVDDRFWKFHGQPAPDGVVISPALAGEVGGTQGDVLLTRLQKPSEIPIESLFGRKEDVARTVRLTLSGVLPSERLGEFATTPQQTGVRAIFAPLRRIQRDLAVAGRVNTVLFAGGQASESALRSGLELDDLGVRVATVADPPAAVIESSSGIVGDGLETAVREAAGKFGVTPVPVFTYLANTIRKGDRAIAYSLITATDLTLLAGSPQPAANSQQPVASSQQRAASSEIVLNDWAARELSAVPGDRIEVDYYLWDATTGLVTKSAAFVLDRVVPIQGFAADRRLAPEYPGITQSNSLADWDPPFPIDLARVRPEDEKYWEQYRTTPKAFIAYEQGRDLWQSRYGRVTSFRIAAPNPSDTAALAERLRIELRAQLAPQSMGITLYPARAAALSAARGATDFGEYFTYFSFFLVVSALMLAVLFFKLGVEQRLRQVGILRATGFTMPIVRRLMIGEAVVLAAVGGMLGVAGAVAYGQFIIYGLRTWWVGAVGTTQLALHVSPVSLIVGAVGGVLTAIVCVGVSLRAVARLSPRALLTAQAIDTAITLDRRRLRRRQAMVVFLTIAAVAMLVVGFVSPAAQAGSFFGAGAALLIGSLVWLSAWLRASDARAIAGRGPWAVIRLGFRSAAFRPARSVLSAALIASAAFIIVSVGAFRRGGGELTADPHSGTGGYVLFAESEVPLLHNPNDPAGRDALMVQAPELKDVRITRFRVRQGQDASCLNLYRPTNPTIVAPERGFAESRRFAFASAMDGSEAEAANPWLLLDRKFSDGAVPVIADATSMQYVLHVGVGDTMTIDTGAQPLILRFVAALHDSVMQGELVMSETQFVRLFPQQQGYRLFLIDAPSVRSVADAEALATVVERELQPFGVDATVTSERLAAFHRVENTYLSTFQALGGLGLLLGTVGLATVMFRNVLERRRELAVLRAVGFDARAVSLMIGAEAGFLLGTGVLAGMICAAIAVAPAWFGRGGSPPGAGLAMLLLAVIVVGLLSSIVATRAALRGRVLEALRAE
jgi:putative ABC transport system permease protein